MMRRDGAMGIPLDGSLLGPLGRVQRAAIRLHHGVRDAINRLDGEPSDDPFGWTLGRAVRELEKRAESLPLSSSEPTFLTGSSRASWSSSTGTLNSPCRTCSTVAFSYGRPDSSRTMMLSQRGR